MKALVLRNGELSLDDAYPDPIPSGDEALIAVRYAGVCDTDIQLAVGYMSFEGVPGHEFVGVVADGPPSWLGKRVVGEINCPCGECPDCRAGRPKYCARRTVLGIVARDGAFAAYLLLPGANLHEVPEDVADERAVFVEPLAAAVNVVERTHIPPTARVAVVGDGKLGLLVAQVLSLTAADVTVVGHHPRRAAKLAAMARALPLIKPADAPGRHYDVVVECTGAADGLAHALRYVRPQGTVVLKTTIADPYNIDFTAAVINEVAVVGNRCGPFAPALKLLAEGAIDPTPLIEEIHPFEDLPAILTRGAPGLKHLVRLE